MVTPPSSPLKNCNPKFPLFNKLLKDCSSSNYRQELKCPATAPILTQSEIDNYRQGERTLSRFHSRFETSRAMEKGGPEKDKDPSSSPIILQDPPKAKLKRQLSINTVEQTESLRSYKRTATTRSSSNRPHCHDSRTRGKAEEEVDLHNIGLSVSAADIYGPSSSFLLSTADEVDGSQPAVHSSLKDRTGRTNIPPSIYCTDAEGSREKTSENKPLPSPNRFNLADIGLTSPFMALTPKRHGTQDEVFVYPESLTPRKISPYKSPISQTEPQFDEPEREAVRRKRIGGESANDPFRDNEAETFGHKYKERKVDYLRESDAREIYAGSQHVRRKEHVTASGFAWPTKATLSDPIPFSPRIVTTDANPRFPSTSAASKYDGYEEDVARLRMLEREHARARNIYGSPPPCDSRDTDSRQMSPTSTVMRDLFRRSTNRSLSGVDRSPNEKEIREVREDVIRNYERSISDPRFSPSQMRNVLQKPSPLTCEQGDSRAGETFTEQGQPQDRFRDPWRDDVKRRLFMRSEPAYEGYQRHVSIHEQRQASISGRASTDIPEEVLEFLHTRNFHPEDLENLKDILRQGGHSAQGQFSPGTPGPPDYRQRSSPSSRYGDRPEIYSPFRRGEGRRSGPGRERRFGDIDVRVSCEDFTEKMGNVSKILKDLDHESSSCSCGRIEENIMKMIENAYDKIPQPDPSAANFDQYATERTETDVLLYNSMKVLCGIKCLCRHNRSLEDVYSGSIVFRLNCPTLDSLLDLWQTYKIGELQVQLQGAFVTEYLLKECGCERVKLKVKIEWKEYLLCKEELELLESSINRTPTKQITVIHARSRSEPASVSKQESQILQPKGVLSPFRERIYSDSSVELSPRRAFQEINGGKYPIHPPPSPSKKFFPDNVFNPPSDESSGSPTTRRKLVPETEQENVGAADVFQV